MKKIALMFAFLLVFAGSYAEKVAKIHVVSSVSAKFMSLCMPGDLIVNSTTHILYVVDSLVGTQGTITSSLATAHISLFSGMTSVPGALGASIVPSVNNTYNLGSSSYKWKDLHLAGNVLIGGTLGVTGASALAAVSGTTGTFSSTFNATGVTTFGSTVGVTGTTTLTKALIHVAAGTADLLNVYNDKATAGDSGIVVNKLGYLGIGKNTATVPLDVVGASLFTGASHTTGVVTLDADIVGNALVRGTAAFVTTATRVAVAIAGGAAGDFYVITPVAPTASDRPVAGDMISVIAKTDSVIFQRQAGTTSGGAFNYIRIK